MAKISLVDISKLKEDVNMVNHDETELTEILQPTMGCSGGFGHKPEDELEDELLNDDGDEHLDARESVILVKDLNDSHKGQKRKFEEIFNEEQDDERTILNECTSNKVDPTKQNKESIPKTAAEMSEKKVKSPELIATEVNIHIHNGSELDESTKAQKWEIKEMPKEMATSGMPVERVISVSSNSNNLKFEIRNEKNDATESKTNTETPENKIIKLEKKIIRLSELTNEERLEMRLKKFGISALTTDAKKPMRPKRFKSNKHLSTRIKFEKISTNLDVLKQRAERFGASVSTVTSSLENKEKMEKRMARFASSTDTNCTLSKNEKAKQQRLERFKQPVVLTCPN